MLIEFKVVLIKFKGVLIEFNGVLIESDSDRAQLLSKLYEQIYFFLSSD